MADILKFKDIEKILIKIQDSKNSPIFETNKIELQIIKRFLHFVINDVEVQIKLLEQSDIEDKVIQLKYAMFLIAYTNLMLNSLDKPKKLK